MRRRLRGLERYVNDLVNEYREKFCGELEPTFTKDTPPSSKAVDMAIDDDPLDCYDLLVSSTSGVDVGKSEFDYYLELLVLIYLIGGDILLWSTNC